MSGADTPQRHNGLIVEMKTLLTLQVQNVVIAKLHLQISLLQDQQHSVLLYSHMESFCIPAVSMNTEHTSLRLGWSTSIAFLRARAPSGMNGGLA